MSGRFAHWAADKRRGEGDLGNVAPTTVRLSSYQGQRDAAATAEKREKTSPTAGRWGGRAPDWNTGGETDYDKEKPEFNSAGLTPAQAKRGKAEEEQRADERQTRKNVEGRYGSGRWGGRVSEKVTGGIDAGVMSGLLPRKSRQERPESVLEPRKLRNDLTPEEKARFEKSGALGSKSERFPGMSRRPPEKFIPGSMSMGHKFTKDMGRWGGRLSDKVATDPPVSEAQRRAMFAAKAGRSNLGIPQSVGKEFAEADPGGKLPERK